MPQVRITAVNKVRNYISYAMSLLEEKGHSSVVLKGMGKAINKTVVVGERGFKCCYVML
jgi:DNA-binding protein